MGVDVRPVRERHDRLVDIVVILIGDRSQSGRFVRATMTVHDPLRHRGKGHDPQQEQQ